MSYPDNILYLHGLGSSPSSAKGQLVKTYFEKIGIPVEIPNLSLPTFATLSPEVVVNRIHQLLNEQRAGRLAVIASSFGGLMAVEALRRADVSVGDRVDRLVLLAPALDPWDPKSLLVTTQVEAGWKELGTHELFDFAAMKPIQVHYRFVDELRLCRPYEARLRMPLLLIHGTRDVVVDFHQSERFASTQRSAGNSRVVLRLIDDGHELLADADRLLEEIRAFLSED